MAGKAASLAVGAITSADRNVRLSLDALTMCVLRNAALKALRPTAGGLAGFGKIRLMELHSTPTYGFGGKKR